MAETNVDKKELEAFIQKAVKKAVASEFMRQRAENMPTVSDEEQAEIEEQFENLGEDEKVAETEEITIED
jgi:hypothetical protein